MSVVDVTDDVVDIDVEVSPLVDRETRSQRLTAESGLARRRPPLPRDQR